MIRVGGEVHQMHVRRAAHAVDENADKKLSGAVDHKFVLMILNRQHFDVRYEHLANKGGGQQGHDEYDRGFAASVLAHCHLAYEGTQRAHQVNRLHNTRHVFVFTHEIPLGAHTQSVGSVVHLAQIRRTYLVAHMIRVVVPDGASVGCGLVRDPGECGVVRMPPEAYNVGLDVVEEYEVVVHGGQHGQAAHNQEVDLLEAPESANRLNECVHLIPLSLGYLNRSIYIYLLLNKQSCTRYHCSINQLS